MEDSIAHAWIVEPTIGYYIYKPHALFRPDIGGQANHQLVEVLERESG